MNFYIKKISIFEGCDILSLRNIGCWLTLIAGTLLSTSKLTAQVESVIARRHGAEDTIMLQVRDLTLDASYQVGFYDLASEALIKRLAVENPNKKRVFSFSSELPPEGVYRMQLEKNGRWLPAMQLPPIQLPKQGFQLIQGKIDRRTQEIRFDLPTNGIYRVTAVNESQMHIAHLQGWSFGAGGDRLNMKWDFWDETKAWNHLNSPGVFVIMDFVPVPSDYVIVGRPLYKNYEQAKLYAGLELPERQLNASISFPRAESYDTIVDGRKVSLPKLGPYGLVRVELDENTLRQLKNRRFEILYFLNGEFLHEEPKGINPGTYRLPKIDRLSGVSYLSINIKDFYGNVGSVTAPIWYQAN